MKSGDAQSDVAGRPTGTVTFLFTDIEGSTRLWQEQPHAMKTAVADHDRIVRTIVGEHDGFIFATGGDGFSVAFAHPVEAALAAFDTQAALAGHDWGPVGSIRVRMALDTGLADERDGDYFGPALNRVARILDQTTGGEILTSSTTADILTHQLPIGYGLERIGRRHLRDVDGVTTLHRLHSISDTLPRPALIGPVAAAIAVVLVVATGWLVLGAPSDTSDSGEVGRDEGGPATTAPSTTAPTHSGTVWTVELGPLTTSPIIIGEYVIAALDTEDHQLVGLDRETGFEAWSSVFENRVTQIDSDGQYVYVTTQRRVEILHPETGAPMGGCGFDHPTALSRTALGEASLLIAEGRSLYRVDTKPESLPCHGDIIENVDSIEVSSLLGPIHAGNHVLIADRRGWYIFDAEDLSLVRKPPAVDVEDLDDVTGALAVWTEEFRMGEAQQVVAAIVDRNARLHVYAASGNTYQFEESTSVQLDRLGGKGEPSSLPVPVIAEGVVAVRRDETTVMGVDSLSGIERWSLSTDEPIGRLVEDDGSVWVASGTQIVRIDASTGTVVQRLFVSQSPEWIAVAAGTVVVAGGNGQLFALGDAEAATDWVSPPARDATDPEGVVRSFYEAWSNGDRRAVQGLLSPGAYIGDKALQFTWLERRQETLWEWMAHDQLIESIWAVGDCTQEALGANRVRLECEATYSDAVFEAIGQPPASFTLISEVRNGAIARITPGRLVTSLRGAGPIADYGAYDLYQSLHTWGAVSYREGHFAACGGTVVTRSTASCAAFVLDHLDEFAVSSP